MKGDEKNSGKILTRNEKEFSGEKNYKTKRVGVCQGFMSLKIRGAERQFSGRAQSSSRPCTVGMHQPADSYSQKFWLSRALRFR